MQDDEVGCICNGCGIGRESLVVVNNPLTKGKVVDLGLFCERCAAWWNGRNSPGGKKFSRPFPPIIITEIERDYFGWDERAINKHSIRIYRTPDAMLFQIDRITDAAPRYFEAYGPYFEDFQGVTPKLPVDEKTRARFNAGISWAEAERLFFAAVQKWLEKEEAELNAI